MDHFLSLGVNLFLWCVYKSVSVLNVPNGHMCAVFFRTYPLHVGGGGAVWQFGARTVLHNQRRDTIGSIFRVRRRRKQTGEPTQCICNSAIV